MESTGVSRVLLSKYTDLEINLEDHPEIVKLEFAEINRIYQPHSGGYSMGISMGREFLLMGISWNYLGYF